MAPRARGIKHTNRMFVCFIPLARGALGWPVCVIYSSCLRCLGLDCLCALFLLLAVPWTGLFVCFIPLACGALDWTVCVLYSSCKWYIGLHCLCALFLSISVPWAGQTRHSQSKATNSLYYQIRKEPQNKDPAQNDHIRRRNNKRVINLYLTCLMLHSMSDER